MLLTLLLILLTNCGGGSNPKKSKNSSSNPLSQNNGTKQSVTKPRAVNTLGEPSSDSDQKPSGLSYYDRVNNIDDNFFSRRGYIKNNILNAIKNYEESDYPFFQLVQGGRGDLILLIPILVLPDLDMFKDMLNNQKDGNIDKFFSDGLEQNIFLAIGGKLSSLSKETDSKDNIEKIFGIIDYFIEYGENKNIDLESADSLIRSLVQVIINYPEDNFIEWAIQFERQYSDKFARRYNQESLFYNLVEEIKLIETKEQKTIDSISIVKFANKYNDILMEKDINYAFTYAITRNNVELAKQMFNKYIDDITRQSAPGQIINWEDELFKDDNNIRLTGPWTDLRSNSNPFNYVNHLVYIAYLLGHKEVIEWIEEDIYEKLTKINNGSDMNPDMKYYFDFQLENGTNLRFESEGINDTFSRIDNEKGRGFFKVEDFEGKFTLEY